MKRVTSRAVTRCAVCRGKFKPARRDGRYCSGRCRQRASRARAESADIDREIEEARRHYWALVQRKAEANGQGLSRVLTAQAQFADEHGNVYMGGAMNGMGSDAKLVGRMTPARRGWAGWGLEAAGPPFSPPPWRGAP